MCRWCTNCQPTTSGVLTSSVVYLICHLLVCRWCTNCQPTTSGVLTSSVVYLICHLIVCRWCTNCQPTTIGVLTSSVVYLICHLLMCRWCTNCQPTTSGVLTSSGAHATLPWSPALPLTDILACTLSWEGVIPFSPATRSALCAHGLCECVLLLWVFMRCVAWLQLGIFFIPTPFLFLLTPLSLLNEKTKQKG